MTLSRLLRSISPKWTSILLVAASMSMLVCVSSTARAETDERAIALGLFEQGRKLRADGRMAEAASKFEGAAKLMRTYGILLNLAECYEKLGRFASAWSTWREAESVARMQRNAEDERRATEHVRELEPRLSYLTIVAPEQGQLAELTITCNGTVVPRAAWATPLPVDPGTQIVEARAPGRRTWKSEVVVQGQADRQSIAISTLELEGGTPPSGSAPAQPQVTSSATQTNLRESPRASGGLPAWVAPAIVGVGVVTAVTGAWLWRGGQTKMNDALTRANEAITDLDRARYDAAASDHGDAKGQRTIGIVTTCAGAVFGAVGVVLMLTRPEAVSSKTGARRYGAWFDGRAGGVSYGATF